MDIEDLISRFLGRSSSKLAILMQCDRLFHMLHKPNRYCQPYFTDDNPPKVTVTISCIPAGETEVRTLVVDYDDNFPSDELIAKLMLLGMIK